MVRWWKAHQNHGHRTKLAAKRVQDESESLQCDNPEHSAVSLLTEDYRGTALLAVENKQRGAHFALDLGAVRKKKSSRGLGLNPQPLEDGPRNNRIGRAGIDKEFHANIAARLGRIRYGYPEASEAHGGSIAESAPTGSPRAPPGAPGQAGQDGFRSVAIGLGAGVGVSLATAGI